MAPLIGGDSLHAVHGMIKLNQGEKHDKRQSNYIFSKHTLILLLKSIRGRCSVQPAGGLK